MYKLDFSGITFYPTGYNNENIFEGRPVKCEDKIVPLTMSWNNETYIIQNTIYPQFECKIYQKETFFVGFEKIKYSSYVTLMFDGATYNCRLSEYNDDNVSDRLNFKEVTIKLYVVSSTVENIEQKVIDTYSNLTNKVNIRIMTSANVILSNINSKFPIVTNYQLDTNVVDNFNNQVKDWSKQTKYHDVRLLMDQDDMIDFIDGLQDVGLSGSRNKIYFLSYGSSPWTSKQYEIIDNSQISTDLYKLDLRIIQTNTVLALWR